MIPINIGIKRQRIYKKCHTNLRGLESHHLFSIIIRTCLLHALKQEKNFAKLFNGENTIKN